MGDKLIIGPINKGLRTDREPFVIDNDSFPKLINAYQWRGRIKRKRGTSILGRLTRFFNSTSPAYNSGSTTITLDGSGVGNILTGFSLQVNGNIVAGSVTLTGPGGPFTDPTMDGFLTPSGTGGPNTINYSTGVITIPAQAGSSYSAVFRYYPDLPVMGLEDLALESTQFPGTLAFDTVYSYNIQTTYPYNIYSVSFYKNLPTGTYTNYVAKGTWSQTDWNGEDYQQFWTTNYQGALWATNGIEVPFTTTNIGMQFAPSSTITFVARTATTIDVIITNCPLKIGDFVFFNEWGAPTAADAQTLNFQTGYVTNCAPNTSPLAVKAVTITFPDAALANVVFTPGIIQYLTTRVDVTKDCLRWYDGDPTDTNATSPTFVTGKGWVNFCPPLSLAVYSIADLPEDQYYLVGARMIVPFKDRLLFLGPVVQTSAVDSQIYLQDTIIYSQNGTPYYTASFTGDPLSSTTVFHPILVPVNQTATAPAYFEDQTGFGGFTTAGLSQPIITSSLNEDVLIVGFSGTQTKLVYSGDDISPFNFFFINSELGSASTFSSINMDKGVITRGDRGYILTSQTATIRVDLDIPDQVFQIRLSENGNERVCSQRDFINEWMYFTYNDDQVSYKFPNQTLQYNYRDDSWAIFNESYTTYGTFREQTGFTWATVGTVFPRWSSWNEPWNAGSSNLLQPYVISGNQQGFIVFRDQGTDESNSLYIQSFSNSLVTSPDHTLNEDDFIVISGCLGTISSEVNGKIFSVSNPTANNFILNPTIGTGTYLGGGVIKRLYVPQIQTKQFPVAWQMARKTRIGVQQYLLTKTSISQIQLLIFLSQNISSAYNEGPIIPDIDSVNDGLIYSSILYTCPESTNLGLSPANINLQMVTGAAQQQIWHRKNTSLIGDTVQLGFTLSEEQMRSIDPSGETYAITGASQAYPCVLQSVNSLSAGMLIRITGVVGMTQLNYTVDENNNYYVISATDTTVTIDVDSSAFDAYISDGTAIGVGPINQTAEIELHGIILDVSPSMVLA